MIQICPLGTEVKELLSRLLPRSHTVQQDVAAELLHQLHLSGIALADSPLDVQVAVDALSSVPAQSHNSAYLISSLQLIGA